MREIEGLVESFRNTRMVYLTTFRDGKERSRQTTNFNEDPYDVIWFPSDMKSRKVEDIKRAPKNQLIVVAFTFFLSPVRSHDLLPDQEDREPTRRAPCRSIRTGTGLIFRETPYYRQRDSN